MTSGTSPSASQENLRYGLRHIEAYLHLHGIKVLGEITHHALRGHKLYLKGRGLSSVSVNDYMTMAKTFFAWCGVARIQPDFEVGARARAAA